MAKNNKNRCPKCGASELEYDINKEKLVCNYCHNEFEPEKIEQINLKELNTKITGEGAKDITNDSDIITIKCNNCGAEIVLNSKDNNYRCHWCHSILSLDSKIENGSVPDLILPFKLEKEEAIKLMNDFANKRKFFANKKFRKEFIIDNIIGVYFPYFIVDVNAHAKFKGEAGHITNRYTKVVGKDLNGNKKTDTFYDIDLYQIEREFDITIDDFEIESSKDRINTFEKNKTNNIINCIMPFDTENCLQYKTNYLIGYNSEKRDLNVGDLSKKINKSLNDIIRHSIKSKLNFYDAGVSWKEELIDYKGSNIQSAYLPVWLYSYQEKDKLTHYIAINARTGECRGSVPINKLRIALMFILLLPVPIITALLVILFINNFSLEGLILSIPIVFLLFVIGLTVSVAITVTKYYKYRNIKVSHNYIYETKREMTNLTGNDNKIREINKSSFRFIGGVNTNRIEGKNIVINKNN